MIDFPTPEILACAAQAYGVDLNASTPLSGGHATAVYRLPWPQEDRRSLLHPELAHLPRQPAHVVLRLLPPGNELTEISLRSILDWMQYLSVNGCPVVSPVFSQAGKPVTIIPTASGVCLASAVTEAEGELAENIPFASWSQEIFWNLGAAVGKMHHWSQAYLATASPSRPPWNQAGNLFNHPTHPNSPPAIAALQEQVMQQVSRLPQEHDAWGLTHLDLHFANFFADLTHHRVTLFDFDDCALGWFVMDLAMLLFDWSVLAPPERREFELLRLSKPLLAGYCSQQTLSPFWLEQIPLFARLLELNLYLDLAPGYVPSQANGWVDKFLFQRQERILDQMPVIPASCLIG